MKNQKNNPMSKYVEKKVGSLSNTELRLTCALAEEELDMRRSSWVHEMYQRFVKKDDANMAFATRAYNPNNRWTVDRVIVTCFTDKSRSKVSTGVSRVSPEDFFDFETGVAIAFARAIGEPVPDLF